MAASADRTNATLWCPSGPDHVYRVVPKIPLTNYHQIDQRGESFFIKFECRTSTGTIKVDNTYYLRCPICDLIKYFVWSWDILAVYTINRNWKHDKRNKINFTRFSTGSGIHRQTDARWIADIIQLIWLISQLCGSGTVIDVTNYVTRSIHHTSDSNLFYGTNWKLFSVPAILLLSAL